MDFSREHRAEVVDFEAFRASRRDPERENRDQPELTPRQVAILSTRQVEHRRRMLAFLLTAR